VTRTAPHANALIGREIESKALIERIEVARKGSGGAIVVRGAPGIGKTSLLSVARTYASENGLEVLTTTGVQSEAHLPFAGLHQLLKPVFHDIERLPAPYGKALQSAFGLSDESVTNPFLVAIAILQLLVESAERAPMLLIVDDAQWLDASTADALAFVARRLESDPIVMMAALRDGFGSPFLEAGNTELAIEALTDAHAGILLDSRGPKLEAAVRTRLLESAAGNPLALIELLSAPRSLDMDRLSGRSDMPLPLRLERAFADRLGSLSSGTRSFLRIAAVDERGRIAEVLAAATKLEGREVTLDAATEASAAGLIEVDGPELRFRHPLMRSAIHQAMTLEERRATHDAFAATLEDPDRRTLHRAAATIGTDRQVAADLEALAQRASRRGAVGVAMLAIERASQIVDSPEQRAIHLARAANLAMQMGRTNRVLHYLDTMDDARVPMVERPFVVTMRESYGRGAWSGATRIAEFVEIAERLRAAGNLERGMTALYVIANRCWWSNPDEATREAVIAVLNRFGMPEDDPRVLSVLAMTDPVEYGARVLEHVSCRMPGHGGIADHQLALAAQAVGDFVQTERFLEARSQFLRAQGLLGGLTSALLKLAWTKIQLGSWRSAAPMASEAERLAEETGQLDLAAAAKLASATIAAYRGELEAAEQLTAEGERALFSAGANPQLAMAQWPRGVAALAAARFDEGYEQLRRIFLPADHAHHPHVRSWVVVDLVEAAVHSEHADEARSIVQDLASIAERSRSPLLLGALQFARALLDAGDDEAAFLADAALAPWPFTRARLQLAHGVWLRRHRRAADSRTPLRTARDTFDALGALPWSERARQELRASGETSRRRSYDLIDALSPQELQIAQLAANGLSNKEIGHQLFLSHRTIGSHLYRIFPKLGITTRSQLSNVLPSVAQPSH